ncbi:MAG TPA: tetratricopeptide repeat protein [Pseudolabrys sp.]|nr:tetratricopeptide repeat protein [Pseudolabrys sp.]
MALAVLARLALAWTVTIAAASAMGDDAGGRLLSNNDVPLTQPFDAKGQFQYFAPDVPLGPRKPGDLRVGFIDSGTSAAHPQLLGLVVEERNFVGGPVHDELGHGTSVMLHFLHDSSAVRQKIPLKSDAPAAMMSAKVTRDGSDLRPESVLAAFNWLLAKNASIINISLGFEKRTPAVEKLCEAIRAANSTLVIAAAGNLGPAAKFYPASCGAENIIAVGAAAGSAVDPSSGSGDVFAEPSRLEARWHFLAQSGMAAARAGDFAQAAKLFEDSLAAQENPLALTQLALIFAREQKWAQARPLLERADQLVPDQDEVIQTLGAVLLALREPDMAIARFDRALQLNSHNQNALLNLARAWASKGERGRALDILQRAQANDPNDPRVGRLRASIDSQGAETR